MAEKRESRMSDKVRQPRRKSERLHAGKSQPSPARRMGECVAQFEAALESVDEGLLICDAAGRVQWMNRRAAEWVGYASGAKAGRAPQEFADVFELYDPQGHPIPVEDEPLNRAVRGETFRELKVRLRNKRTGREWIGRCGGTPVRDERGQVVLTVLSLRERAEPADRAIEELTRLARISQENPDPVFRVSAEHVLLYSNPAGEKLCQMWRCRTGWKVPAVIRTIVSAALADGAVAQHEITFDSRSYWLTVAPSVADGCVNIYARDITDHKRAKEALRQAEQKFRTIFDNTSDGIFLLDLETRKLTMCNQSCLEILGYTQDEFVNLGIPDLHLQDDLPFIDAQIEEFVKGREGIRHDIRFKRKDGSILFTDVSPDLVVLDGRRYVLVALKDISERKRAEEALAESEEKYRSLVENIPDVTWTTDREGRTLFISPNVRDVYGYSAGEIYAGGDTWLGNVHPDDRPRVEKAFAELFTEKKAYDIEYRIRRKDGNWIWLHDRSVSSYEKEGRWYADGVFSEITERKRMEEELRLHAEHLEELVAARTGELQESETRYRSLYHTIADAVFVVDEKGQIEDVNDSACAQLGYTREELIGMPVSAVSARPGFDLGEVFDRLRAAGSLSYETAHRRKDGSTIPVELSVALTEYRDQPAVLGVARDITERKRAEEALRKSEERFAKAFRSSPIAIAVTRLSDGRIIEVNEAVLKLLHFNRDEVMGRTTLELGIWVDVADRAEYIRRVSRDGSARDLEYRLRTRDGDIVTIQLSAESLKLGGEPCMLATLVDLTARKQAEEALAESRKKYRGLVEKINDWVWEVDTDYVYTYSSPRALELLGYAPEEIVGRTPFDFMPPDEAQRVRNAFQSICRARKPLELLENTLVRKDGRLVTVETSGMPVFAEDGSFLGYTGIDRDVTSRKEAEEALRFTQFAIDHTADAAFWMTDDGRFFYVNEAACQALGYSYEELLQMTVYDIDPAFTRSMWSENWRKLKAEKSIVLETVHQARDGRIYPVEIRANYLEFGGRAYDCAFARDITTRKRAREALEESEQRYRRLVENLKGSHFVYRHDTAGMFTYVSESVTQVLGYTLDEGMPHYSKYFTDHPANQAAHRYTEMTLQGIRQPAYEVNVWHKDGSTRWLEVQEVPVCDANGKVVAVEGVAQDITGRKRAEEALLESEERYRILLESGFDGIFVHEDFRIVQLNDRLTEMTGYTRAELMGSRAFDVFTPESQERIRQYIDSQATGYFEIELRRRDGQIVDVESYGTSCRFQGRPARIVGLRDITERKRAREALQESEEKFRLLAETSSAAIIIYQGGRFVYMNPAAESITGYGPDELLKMSPLDLIHPDFREMAENQIFLRLHAIERQSRYEVKILTKDGREKWMDNSSVLIVYKNEPASLVVALDITERKQAEEALQESEEKFRLLAETSPAAILIYQDGKYVYANPAIESITGYQRAEFLLQEPTDIIHPDYRQKVGQMISQRARGLGPPMHYELKVLTKDGQERWMDSATASMTCGNRAAGLVVAFDITERKRAEEALRSLNEQLEVQVAQRTEDLRHTVERLRQLTLELSQAEDRERKRIADILHEDVQQTLAAAKFHLNLLGHETRSAEESQEIIEQVKQLLRDAIEKSRSLSHELSPALYQVDLLEILKWLACHMRQKHGLTVTVDAHGPVDSPSEPLKAFLYKVAQELLFNVVKHAGVSEARICVRRRGRCIYLSVVDQGRGFDPQGLAGAAGFGLLGVRERVELLGGRMKIRSRRGMGSRLLIAVPDRQATVPTECGDGQASPEVSAQEEWTERR
jgi:PAS domain S-box-containing protein